MKLKQISRKTVALVLSVLMILSTLSVGIISTNAAYIAQQESGANLKTFYLNLSSFTDWDSSARFAVYAFNGSSNKWYSMIAVPDNSYYYYCNVDTSAYNTLIFCRMNGSTTENKWENKWNQTENITISDTKNMCTITGWKISDSNSNSRCTMEAWSAPAASVSATVTGYQSGSGTSSDPYIFKKGATASVTASATNVISDTNISVAYKYAFNNDTYSTTDNATISTDSVTSSNQTYTVKAKSYFDSFDSSTVVTTNIYYKVVEEDYYVSGTKELVNCGKDWQTSDSLDKLTNNNDGTYSITYTKDANTEGAYKFKVTDGKNWWGYYADASSESHTEVSGDGASIENNGGNIILKLEKKSTVKITFNPSKGKITIVASAITHNVTFSQPTNGTITVNNSITSPQSLAEGESYTVTLTPKTGYEVDTFTVGGTDKKSLLSHNTYTGTMGTSDVAIAATFKKTNYTLTKASTTNGSFTLSAETAQYGDKVTVNLTPNTGYKVASVKYDGSDATMVSDKQYEFEMPATNTTVTVTFAPVDYTVTTSVSPTGSGSISVTKNSTSVTTYNIGDALKFTATPNAGYEFVSITVKYSDDTTETLTTNGATLTISKIGGITVTANFKEKTKYSITAISNDTNMGTVTVSPTSTYAGDTVTISTTANTGYKLVSVSAIGAADGTVLPVSGNEFTMPAQAVTVTATFEAYQNHNVTVNSGITGGSVSVSSTSAIYDTTITVTVTPDEGYTCTGVTAGSQPVTKSSDTTYTFKMPDSNVTVSATFEVSKARDIYVAGRFYANGSWLNGGTWSPTLPDENFKFKRVGKSEIYRFDTGETIKTLSDKANSDGGCYFRFYETTDGGNKQFGSTTADNLLLTGGDAGVQKALSINGKNLKFNDGSNTSTKTVVLYLDYTGTKAGDAPKFYFKLEAPVAKFTVNMEQGVSNRGPSYLDGNTSLTTVKHTYDDPAVLFTTSANTGYKVFGYQIKMTLNDGKTVLASTTDISMLPGNKYQASYTFPDNVMSATVTPVFASSTAELTTVYLKMKPGDNDLNKVYEPCYYTWVTDSEGVKTNEPEGNWPGQKLLYIGNDTYMAVAETAVSGIVFNNPDDDGKYQTYDYDEFVKLNKLGYKQVTFELKKGTKDGLNKTIADNQALATCQDTAYSTPVITKDSMNETVRNGQFELDTNIEGYYIDVFGDRLVGTDGRFIHQDDINGTTTTSKLNQILAKLGKTSGAELYGARYGWYSEDSEAKGNRNASYDMEYCIRTYFMDFDETKINVAQLVSGYGQIEGGHGPLSGSNQTNAQYMNSQGNAMKYYIGTNTTKTFSTGNEVLETKYRGVPYLVSYMARTDTRATEYDKEQTDGHNRVDGKWYYQAEKPQLTVKAKAGLMNEDGTIVMTDGKITEQPDTIGTGYVNGASEAVVPQGDTCTLSGTPANGYKLVGFYSETGELLPSSTPVVGSSATYFAVFQALPAGTVTLTNTIYRFDNPTHSGGSGSLGVKLIVTPYITSSDTYGDPVTYTGSSSVTAPISDNDKLQWVITGKASGADEFIAFRQPEQQADGTVYYAALDDPDCLSADSSSATYTSYEIIWNWAKQDTSGNKKLVINEYTDFRKVSVMATLEYKYKNRFDEWRTYTVKNVELSTEEIEKGYIPSNETIAKHAPAIDEVFQSCTWNVSQTGKLETGKSYALLTADQELKTFRYRIANGGASIEGKKVPYNTMITLDAPDKDSEGKVFAYWRQYKCDDSGNITGDPEIFSFEKYEQVRVTFNRYFEAVYSDKRNPTFITNLQDAVYTREKYTDESGNTKDYIYSDFLMQFETSVKGLEMRDFVNGTGNARNIATNVKFGIILERDMNYPGYSGSDNITAPTPDIGILKTTVTDNAKNLTAGGTANGWSSTSDTSKPQYNYYYHFFDYTDRANQLTDKGRIDGYFKYENTAENRAKVYNAYTYIIYHDVVADKDVVILSSPKVMSMYDIGIKDDGTSAY